MENEETSQWVDQIVSFSSEFSAENWSARNLRGPPTCNNTYGDNASAWFTSLKRSSVDALKWDVFKRAFLSVYGSDSETTSASHTVDFAALKQGPEERVLEFYTRVVKVSDPTPIL